jgi:hypothetical protein
MPTTNIKTRKKGKADGHMVKTEVVANDESAKKHMAEFSKAMKKASKFGNF